MQFGWKRNLSHLHHCFPSLSTFISYVYNILQQATKTRSFFLRNSTPCVAISHRSKVRNRTPRSEGDARQTPPQHEHHRRWSRVATTSSTDSASAFAPVRRDITTGRRTDLFAAHCELQLSPPLPYRARATNTFVVSSRDGESLWFGSVDGLSQTILSDCSSSSLLGVDTLAFLAVLLHSRLRHRRKVVVHGCFVKEVVTFNALWPGCPPVSLFLSFVRNDEE